MSAATASVRHVAVVGGGISGLSAAYYLRQGQPVIVPHAPPSGWVRLAEIVGDDSTRFIGVGEILDDGRVAPRRLVVGEGL